MSLKNQLILILLAAGFIMALFFHFSINTTILPNLKQQKKVFIENQELKFRMILTEEERSLNDICNNLAGWSGMINYIKNPSLEFENEFFTDSPFLSPKVNVILVLDAHGKIIYSRNRNDGNFSAFNHQEIKGSVDETIRHIKQARASVTGIINSGDGPLMFSACPIYDKTPPAPTTGILMLGCFTDQEFIKRISIHFTEPMILVPFNDDQHFNSYLRSMQEKEFYYSEDEEKITLFYLVKAMDRAPSFILKIMSDSRLPGSVKKHTFLYIFFTVLSIIILGFLVYFLIGKHITKRISKISSDMKNIQGLKTISTRIRQDGVGDEISSLIANINETLDKIESEKKSREEIEQLLITNEKLVSIGRLSGSIAHEINSPILAISNCIQALKKACLREKDRDYELKQKAITVSESEINRIRNIVSSLLDYQRSDIEELTEVSLDEVMMQSLEVLKWSKKLSSIEIKTMKQQDFFVIGSQGRLKQVFINFILNAVEACIDNNPEPKLLVEIRPAQEKDFCEVHFKDNGPGILPGVKNRLFEPFVSTKQGKGVGLGLYVSYKIIKNHHGEILYDDTYKGGAHFIIKLPVKERHL